MSLCVLVLEKKGRLMSWDDPLHYEDRKTGWLQYRIELDKMVSVNDQLNIDA